MKTGIWLRIMSTLGVMLLVPGITSCGDTSTSTPDIEATVQARVAAELASEPTATPSVPDVIDAVSPSIVRILNQRSEGSGIIVRSDTVATEGGSNG